MIFNSHFQTTKTGAHAVWEWGGGRTNTGEAQIVAGKGGEPLRPIYLPKRMHSNGEHALLPVTRGCLIFQAERTRRGVLVIGYKILGFKADDVKAKEIGRWRDEDKPPRGLANAVNAAREKAYCHHCREPHYFDVGRRLLGLMALAQKAAGDGMLSMDVIEDVLVLYKSVSWTECAEAMPLLQIPGVKEELERTQTVVFGKDARILPKMSLGPARGAAMKFKSRGRARTAEELLYLAMSQGKL